jgi:hypothetical protein
MFFVDVFSRFLRSQSNTSTWFCAIDLKASRASGFGLLHFGPDFRSGHDLFISGNDLFRLFYTPTCCCYGDKVIEVITILETPPTPLKSGILEKAMRQKTWADQFRFGTPEGRMTIYCQLYSEKKV